MTTPPEIERLHLQASQPSVEMPRCVSLRDAEAAVRACEQRVQDAADVALADALARRTRHATANTAREIVKALRDEARVRTDDSAWALTVAASFIAARCRMQSHRAVGKGEGMKDKSDD